MPYTDEFKRIRRGYRRKYSDIARADTFAFSKALKERIPTWRERDRRIKKQVKNEKFAII